MAWPPPSPLSHTNLHTTPSAPSAPWHITTLCVTRPPSLSAGVAGPVPRPCLDGSNCLRPQRPPLLYHNLDHTLLSLVTSAHPPLLVTLGFMPSFQSAPTRCLPLLPPTSPGAMQPCQCYPWRHMGLLQSPDLIHKLRYPSLLLFCLSSLPLHLPPSFWCAPRVCCGPVFPGCTSPLGFFFYVHYDAYFLLYLPCSIPGTFPPVEYHYLLLVSRIFQ